MAKLSKQLHLQKGSTETVCNIYGTTSEAGSVYVSCTVDSQNAYIPLVSTSDARASVGRATKGGTTYAIGKAGVVAYATSGILTTSGTFTVPTDVYKLRVTCVGGGAGGCIEGWTPLERQTRTRPESAGGTTTFSSVTASGATPFVADMAGDLHSGQEGTSLEETIVYSYTVSQGYNNGAFYWGRDSHAGADATPILNISGTQVGSAGAGGYADGGNREEALFTGGSGYRTTGYVNVTPGQKIAYTVGAGGAWFSWGNKQSDSWNSNGRGGAPGNPGAIFVEWGQGV